MCLPLLMAAWLCISVGVFVCTFYVYVYVLLLVTTLSYWLVAASLHHQSKRSLNLYCYF